MVSRQSKRLLLDPAPGPTKFGGLRSFAEGLYQ
jgi:hypothetical protein